MLLLIAFHTQFIQGETQILNSSCATITGLEARMESFSKHELSLENEFANTKGREKSILRKLRYNAMKGNGGIFFISQN